MGEKKNKNGGEKKSNGKDDGGKKEVTVVLDVNLHCEGCSSKIVKYVRSIEGVDKVKCDLQANKLTVVGQVDPAKLWEMVEHKMKKVDLVSPAKPKKDKGKDKKQKNDKAGDGQDKQNGSNNKKKKDANKHHNQKDNKQELPVTTAVMKVQLHCEGCIDKINKFVTKTKGFHDMAFDRAMDLVTVKGSMDMSVLAEAMKKHLKKHVEIIPAKKESGGENKEKGGSGGGQGKGGGEGKATFGPSGAFLPQPGGFPFPIQYPQQYPNPFASQYPYAYPNPYPQHYVHEPGYPVSHHVHAPQLFSDENPNACSVM